MIGRSVVNINIGFGIQIILNLLLFTLITTGIWFSCYLDPDEIGRTFQSPYFQGLFHNSQLCKYVLLNVALQQYFELNSKFKKSYRTSPCGTRFLWGSDNVICFSVIHGSSSGMSEFTYYVS